MIKQTFPTPEDAVNGAKKIGEFIKIARKRRNMTQEDAAMRIGVNREIIIRAEQGKVVGSHNLLALLWLFGLLNQAIDSVSPVKDIVGTSMENQRLKKRIRRKGNGDFDDF
jgi:transcriptional regulator with XRE-family HTH domain